MKNIVLALLLLLPARLLAFEMKVGDVLLQPRDCWSCTLIEEQEGSIYSHMGMVIQVSPLMVIDALGTVKIQTYDAFNAGTEKGQKIAVLRLRREDAVEHLQEGRLEFLAYYLNYFDGLKYDHDFLWNNLDENDEEKLYCSEMVTKLLKGFMGIEVGTRKMKFDKNREQWIRYFKGNPPDGKIGNSPAVFEQSELFYVVGEL
jgi:Permuted papain-like amidase enzyme, YaeF/YiiX, C92 family